MPPDDRAAQLPHLAAVAQAAIATMAEEFGPLLHQELARLANARERWIASGDVSELRLAAHDLRGLGGLYGAPVAGRIAGSLERLLTAAPHRTALVSAHVEAIAAVVRENAAAADDANGAALAAALESALARIDPAALPQAA